MASDSGNVVYLVLNGVQVQAQFIELNFQPSNSPEEVTAGSGTAHVQRNAGLDDTKLDISITHDSTATPGYIVQLKPGSIYNIEFGFEGNAAGKPKHIQKFILQDAPISVSVKKTQKVWKLAFLGADAPSIDSMAGATY